MTRQCTPACLQLSHATPQSPVSYQFLRQPALLFPHRGATAETQNSGDFALGKTREFVQHPCRDTPVDAAATADAEFLCLHTPTSAPPVNPYFLFPHLLVGTFAHNRNRPHPILVVAAPACASCRLAHRRIELPPRCAQPPHQTGIQSGWRACAPTGVHCSVGKSE